MKKKKFWIMVVSLFVVVFLITLLSGDNCSKKDNSICVITAAGGHKIKASVAYSRQAQAKGLMGVDSLKNGRGMIFVYDAPEQLSFWMKNTLIPLSIAFVEADGRIAAIYDMKTEVGRPDFVLPTYTAPTAVKYAIEVPEGWFSSNGLKTSDYLIIPKELR